jgi:hypothetical protein
MTGKRQDIPVAVLNDDGTSRIVGSDDLRAQRDAHGAKWLAPAFAKDHEFSPHEMLQYLAMNKRDPDFGIPADVIDAIAIAIAGKGAWLKAQEALQEGNEKKQSEADRRREEVRRAAESLRAKNPGISEGRLEKILAKEFNCSDRTIRRYITN